MPAKLALLHSLSVKFILNIYALALNLYITLQVNPATAYNMLSDFVNLKEGDWVIQNGANSAVSYITSDS